MKNGDTVELTATPLKDSYVKFSEWVVYNGKGAKATLDKDYTLTETEPRLWEGDVDCTGHNRPECNGSV